MKRPASFKSPVFRESCPMNKRLIWFIPLLILSVFLFQNNVSNAQDKLEEQYLNDLATWRTILKDMFTARLKYEASRTFDESEIYRKVWKEKYNEGLTIKNRIKKSGFELFKRNPNSDPDLRNMLINLAKEDIDNRLFDSGHEISVAIVKAMEKEMEGKEGNINPQIYDIAGQGAFFVNNFDQAKEFFTKCGDENLSEQSVVMKDDLKLLSDLWAKEKVIRKLEIDSDENPIVVFTVPDGEIKMELFEVDYPNTVANFMALVDSKFYEGLTFYYVTKAFAETGSPSENGRGGPGYEIENECLKEGDDPARLHFRGSLSTINRNEENTKGMFCICLATRPERNGKNTCFGRVVSGMDTVAKLKMANPDQNQGGIQILSTKIIRKRKNTEYKLKKLEAKD